jgi:hypothetical protein
MTTTTELASKCDILNDIWINYSDHEFFEDFIEINDLGLPLAYFICNGIVEVTPLAIEIIDVTFADLLELFEVEDEGYTSLQDFWGFA